LLIYDAFLKRETFFNYNRLYLLATAVLSFVLPLVQLQVFANTMPEALIINLPEVVIGNIEASQAKSTLEPTSQIVERSSWKWLYVIYAGMLIATSLFVIKLFKLLYLIEKNPKRWHGDILLIKLLKSTAAFSFFNRVFIGDAINETERNTILQHEMVHVNHKHSIDLLLFEVLRIVMWFNPLIYMYQSRITALHEYIADAEATKNQDKQLYYQNLLAQVFDTNKISFINPFYKQSLIKKRIVMLSKSKSKQLHLIKYALLIPMVIGMLMYTSSQAQVIKTVTSEEVENLTDEELIDKFLLEIQEREKAGDNFLVLFNEFFLGNKEAYISSRLDYAKFMAFYKYLNEKSRERKKINGLDLDENSSNMNLGTRSYQEYLEWKQTDEAKKLYESRRTDKSFRMVVNSVSQLTEIENNQKNRYLKIIKNDDDFDTLILADLKGETLFLQTDRSKLSENRGGLYSGSRDTNNFDEIPYAIVERVPAFEGCETLPTNQQIKECTSQNISQFINKNFDISIAEKAGLKGRQRVSVVFKINKNGEIVDVRSRAAHPDLEAEAKRVIESIPPLTPGQHKGENIKVMYSLPIIFQISE
jgi:hypothetical protein